MRVALFLILFSPALGLTHNVIEAEVYSVYDGDSFRANITNWPTIVGDRVPIRVAGIDTPELRGKCDHEKTLARQAKQLTKSLLPAGKKIQLSNIKRGKYFRLVADVTIDDQHLATMLISAGLAVEYHGGTKVSWCE